MQSIVLGLARCAVSCSSGWPAGRGDASPSRRRQQQPTTMKPRNFCFLSQKQSEVTSRQLANNKVATPPGAKLIVLRADDPMHAGPTDRAKKKKFLSKKHETACIGRTCATSATYASKMVPPVRSDNERSKSQGPTNNLVRLSLRDVVRSYNTE